MNLSLPPPPALPQRQSLAAQTAQCLREGIASGHWTGRLPAERELCDRLQVSRRTLRAALLELQQQGWLEGGRSRQKRPIKPTAGLNAAAAPRKVVAVLSPCSPMELAAPTMFVLDTLRNKIAESGTEVEFHVRPACFTAKPEKALAALTHEHPAAAWVIVGSKRPMQRWFVDHHQPCLVIGSCGPDVQLPSIDLDYRATCRHAGAVLWRASRRRIALVTPRDAYGGDLESEKGLREALAELPDAALQVLRHDGTTGHLCALLDASLRKADRPTAYLVVGARAVISVMMHLMRRGVRIPQDAAVLARDDDPYLRAASPAVAHYTIDRRHIARRVAKAARRMAEGGHLPATALRVMPGFAPGETL